MRFDFVRIPEYTYHTHLSESSVVSSSEADQNQLA